MPTQTLSQLSIREREIFLRVVQESVAVDCHLHLFLWLQGVVQKLIPHDALVSAVGDFAQRRIRLDMVSGLPGVRTPACPHCRHDLAPDRFFERWKLCGRQVMAIEGSLAGLFAPECDCRAATSLRSLRSVMVHGLRDERSGEDALYLMFGVPTHALDSARGLFALLLPVIDSACRRVVPLVAYSRETTDLEASLAELRDSAGVSSREQEILVWVRAGKTNYEIGQILNISAFTVKNHLQRIYRKIDVINRAQAVAKLEGCARSR